MSTQLSVVSNQLSVRAAAYACNVVGCDARITAGFYCRRCAEEIDALRRMSAERVEETTLQVVRFERAARWVRKWLWVPELIFVIGVLMLLGLATGDAFVEWVKAGGMQ
jgi:hypothetical protein